VYVGNNIKKIGFVGGPSLVEVVNRPCERASGRPVVVVISIGLSQFRPAIASITSHPMHVGRVIIVLVGHTQRTTDRENPVNPAIDGLSLILC
jgi:hypothetical protein